MDWSTLGNLAAGAAAGGYGAYKIADAQNKQTAAMRDQYAQALALLQAAQNPTYRDAYGNVANANGTFMANSGLQAGMNNVNAETMALQLQAQRLANAKGNMTDYQARNQAYANSLAQIAAQKNAALNNTAQIMLSKPANGQANVGSLYNKARQQGIQSANMAAANARGVTANNNTNYMQNPLVTGLNNVNNMYNIGQNGYTNALASMTANKPTYGMSAGSAGSLGALGGLFQGLNNMASWSKKNG